MPKNNDRLAKSILKIQIMPNKPDKTANSWYSEVILPEDEMAVAETGKTGIIGVMLMGGQ